MRISVFTIFAAFSGSDAVNLTVIMWLVPTCRTLSLRRTASSAALNAAPLESTG
jgi:hypothetical protein